jgi:aminoglycoside phosphotransferase (APT) family kinase protein
VESLTKNRQPIEVLRAMTARAFGPGEVDDIVELGHGWFNVAYRLRLRDGRAAVLKIAPPPGVDVMTYERGAMAIELAALDLIRAHTSVPVPEVLHADRSRELCDADWFVMTFVEGDNYGMVRDTLPRAEQDTYDEALAAATRRLNEIPGPAFGPLAGPGSATWRECFTAMIEDILYDGERRTVDLGPSCADVRAALTEHAGCLDEVTEPRFVEWDLYPNNVMIAGGRITGIIDHERAFYGDPLIEACFVGTESAAFGDPAAYLRGYGKAALTPAERGRRRLYNLHLALILVVECTYRGFTGDHLAWARGRLDEAMAALKLPR